MPRYDYQCVICMEIYIDLERPITDDKGVYCCDMPMEQIYTAPAIQFKGKGFYSTDK